MIKLKALFTRFLGNPLMQRVVRNTGYLFSAQTLVAGLSFGQGVLAARLLGVEGAGIVGIITQYASNINRLISFRMHELVISYVGEFSANGHEQDAMAVFKGAALAEIGASVVAYLLAISLAPVGAAVFAHDRALAGLFRFYALSVLANLMYESAYGLLQYFNRYRVIAAIMIGQSVLTLGLIARAYLRRGELSDVVLAYLSGKVVLAVLTSLAALAQARAAWGPGWWKVRLARLSQRGRDLLRFAVNRNINGTLRLVTRDSEALWLGALTSPLQVGYYKIARAIINFVAMPVDPLIRTTYRELSIEVARSRWENVRYLLRSGTLLSAVWTLPASLFLILFGKQVVSIYGPNFLPTSYESLLILLVGVMVSNLLYWSQMVLLPMGMPEFPTKVQAIGALLMIAGMLVLVPLAGSNGMALLMSAFLVFTVGVSVVKTMREIWRAQARKSTSTG
jgi:O-antigen/teichoic acid export membrane protein